MRGSSAIVVSLLVVTGAIFANREPTASIIQEEKAEDPRPPTEEKLEPRVADIPLIIIGEGGTSGFLFQYAADTYVLENGGAKYTANDGDEFIAAMLDFYKQHGAISHFVYFGHGNEVGLYVNQSPTTNGALYVNDPQLNEPFRAASIYELSPSIFAPDSTSLFYGCNVARKNPGLDSFAEQFANHFRTVVTAPTGPTEFSFSEDKKGFLKEAVDVITQPLYMVPTVDDRGFITIRPSPAGVAGYPDVYESMDARDAIEYLTERKLTLGWGKEFQPYTSITYADARAFCDVINPDDACVVEGHAENDIFRNTAALKLLLDAAGYKLQRTNKAYEAQIYFATQNNLLTHDFTKRRWYSRAEMAELTDNILRFSESH